MALDEDDGLGDVQADDELDELLAAGLGEQPAARREEMRLALGGMPPAVMAGIGGEPAWRPPDALLDVALVAQRLSVGQRTLWRWIRQGKFPPPLHLGRLRRWEPAIVDRWLQARRCSLSGEFRSWLFATASDRS
jgi:predicted DNA-binding transcriptional regulator AlpA